MILFFVCINPLQKGDLPCPTVLLHPPTDVLRTQELDVKIRLNISNRAASIAVPQEIILIDGVSKNLIAAIESKINIRF